MLRIFAIIVCVLPWLSSENSVIGANEVTLYERSGTDLQEISGPPDTSRVDDYLDYLDANRSFRTPDSLLVVAERAVRLSDSLVAVYKGGHKVNAKNRKAAALMHVSMLNATIGDTGQARRAAREAIINFKSTGHRQGLAKAYGNLATTYVMYGDFVPGLKYQLLSLKLLEEIKDSASIAASYYNIAITYLETGDFKTAKSYVFRSMKIRSKRNEKIEAIDCLSLLGGIYYENGEHDLALSTHKKALEESKKVDYELIQGEILANIANVYAQRKNYDTAIYYYEAAREIQLKFSDALSLTRTLANLGFVYTGSGNYKKAKGFLLAAIDSLKKYPDDSVLETVYDKLVSCDSALGNMNGAIRFSRLGKEVGIRNSSGQTKTELLDLRHQYEIDKKARENQQLMYKSMIQDLELRRTRLVVIALGIIFLFALLIFFLLYRHAKLKAANTTIELQQRLLRTQMNPHFIFNALQAIHNFARNNETGKLLSYLEAFANLTRDVLENSRVELIPLSREMVLLQNYLSVQKLRFGNRFEYNIHVDDDIRTDAVFLPPMLSQPFIENAIEHGFAEMDEGGKLDIRFKTEDNYLLMEITDNGVGIQKSETQQGKHASLAIAITKERIALLNRKDRHKAEFSITAAYPENETGQGVRVLFRIRLS